MLNSAILNKIHNLRNKVTICHRPGIIIKPNNRNIVPSYSSTVNIYDIRFEDRLFGDKEGLQTLHNWGVSERIVFTYNRSKGRMDFNQIGENVLGLQQRKTSSNSRAANL